jgi:pilus assembly protein CpaF
MENENTVWKLVNDLNTKKGITEIVINGPKSIFVERGGQFIQLNFAITKQDIYQFIDEVADYNKKVCNEDAPILDGNLPDGSRINVITEPFATGFPSISIRKYIRSIVDFDSSPGIFGLDEKWIEFLKAAVSARMNIIVSGGTGVGKTTFMNLLLKEMSPAERIVTIEDTLELNIDIPNIVRLEAGSKVQGSSLSVRDLVKNTLRMRPDRIILGEIRGGEFFDLLQAMNTGHDGSMTSLHSSSASECINRMETLFLMSGYDVPYHVVRKQMSTAIDLILQISRDREGKRILKTIQEVTGMEGSNILSQTIGTYEEGKIVTTGITPKNMEKLHHMGALPMDFFNN